MLWFIELNMVQEFGRYLDRVKISSDDVKQFYGQHRIAIEAAILFTSLTLMNYTFLTYTGHIPVIAP